MAAKLAPLKFFPVRREAPLTASDTYRSWYFKNSAGQRIRCRSGYEALFATYLVSRTTGFEYEPFTIGIPGIALYTPDFLLHRRGEFVELKGWVSAKTTAQTRAIAALRKRGIVIHMLDWNGLREAIHSPFKQYTSFYDHAKRSGLSNADFFASGKWVGYVVPRRSFDSKTCPFSELWHV